MTRHWQYWFLSAVLTTLACTLTGTPVTPTPATTPTPLVTGAPAVVIESPDEGDEVTVGDNVLVSALATDTGGVTSVQLFANERLVKTVSSESVEGDRTLPVVLDYEARAAGEVQLEVVAFRGTVSSDPATVTISVLEEEQEVVSPVQPAPSLPVINPNDPTCRILTNVALNYRTGPGVEFERLGTFAAGTQAPIVGRVADNSWWQVQATAFTRAWVSSDFTTEYGVCLNIPVIAATPTPAPATPTPVPTLTPTLEPSVTPTITPTPLPPDLVVSDITGLDELTLQGGSVTATYSVLITNTGGTPTGGQFMNTLTILPGNTQIELGVIGTLNPGESIVLNRDVTFTAAGDFTLQAQTDSGNFIAELSEVNNVGIKVVTVSAG